MPRPANQARKAKKRPKGFFKKCSSGKRPRWERKLDVGMKGVLLTCNRDERQCTREAYNLMNEYADELYGAEVVAGSYDGYNSDEGDIADALEKEVTEMNEQRQQKTMRFQSVDSRAKNVIFIRTKINDDPANFVLHILEKMKASGQCKSQHIQRMLPVTMTCRATLDQIEKTIKPLLEPIFHSPDSKDSTYSVLFKTRNNNEIRKDEVITVVANAVTSGAACKHTVDLDDPDYFILAEVVCNVCCLSVLKDYNLLKKYNVRAIVGEPLNGGNDQRGRSSGNVEKEPQGGNGVNQAAEDSSVTGDVSVAELSHKSGDGQKCEKTADEVEKTVKGLKVEKGSCPESSKGDEPLKEVKTDLVGSSDTEKEGGAKQGSGGESEEVRGVDGGIKIF